VFRIRIGFSADPDPAFLANVDSDADPIRIQDFDDKKMKKITAAKKVNIF
jgi:hypothetical protein